MLYVRKRERVIDKLRGINGTGKRGYGTYFDIDKEHRSTAKTRQTTGLPLLPCPRVPLSNLTRWCQVRIDRL
jgi:hypothetical protein